MVYPSEFSKPPAYYSGTNRSRSSSLSRYSSPARFCYVPSCRDSTPLASYGVPSPRIIPQETSNSPCSSRRSSIRRTNNSSRCSSFSRELLPEKAHSPCSSHRSSLSRTNDSSRCSSFSRELLPETAPSSGRRDSLSSLSSSRRSSIRNSPAPTQKHVHFNKDLKETDKTTSLVSNRRSISLEPTQRIDRKSDSGVRMKLSSRDRYPSINSDDCRKRQARAAYLSALNDIQNINKSREHFNYITHPSGRLIHFLA